MNISEQIANQWTIRQKEIEMVWWLLPRFGKQAANDVTAKLQARIMACLLMTPFSSESGQQVGAELAQQFGLYLEKLGRLQQLLAEQLLTGLSEEQVAWLTPRLTSFWAEMVVGYGQILRAFYEAEQAAQEQQLTAEFQRLTEQVTDSDQRFEALFKGSYQPVFLHKNGRILVINHAVTKQFGYTAEDLIGEQVQSLIQTLTLPSEQEAILKQMAAGRERPYQTQCLTKEGTAVAVEATARHVNYRGHTVRMVILRPLDDSFAPLLEPDEVDLTPQQQAVLHEMATGFADKEIAQRLDVSLSTVQYHKKLIFERLQVDTRAKAIAWVWQKLPPLLDPE